MTQDALLQKIKHIQALAERGERGEKDRARELLARLMEKYSLTEADLENERAETAWFTYHDELERRILQQIIYAVTGKPSFGCVGTYTNRKRKKRGVECTAAEKLEIEANHAFFYEAAKKEMEVFLYAFYMKNGLFPSGDKVETKEWEELTPEQKEEVLKASMMAEGMERHTLRKALGDGSGHEGGGLNDG